jgi:hypothetical protein
MALSILQAAPGIPQKGEMYLFLVAFRYLPSEQLDMLSASMSSPEQRYCV